MPGFDDGVAARQWDLGAVNEPLAAELARLREMTDDTAATPGTGKPRTRRTGAGQDPPSRPD